MPILWLLLAIGLTERIIFNQMISPERLLENFRTVEKKKNDQKMKVGMIPISSNANMNTNANTQSSLRMNTNVIAKDYFYINKTKDAWNQIYNLYNQKNSLVKNPSELGRRWLFKKFMNPRNYDLLRLATRI